LGRGAVATILSNLGLEKFLESHQIPLYRSKVGDREVVTEMERRGAKFGGEQSGHLIFRDYLPTGDGLLSSLFLLRFLIEEGIPASRLHSLFPTYPQLQRSLPIHRKPRLEEIEPLQNLLREIEQGGYRAVVRYSGTEPKVRLLVEGPTLDGVEERIWKLETLLRRELQ
jgi:phosphoglucosamine mutase